MIIVLASHLYNSLDYGVIGWNDGGPSAAHAPFGGMKESGYGRRWYRRHRTILRNEIFINR